MNLSSARPVHSERTQQVPKWRRLHSGIVRETGPGAQSLGGPEVVLLGFDARDVERLIELSHGLPVERVPIALSARSTPSTGSTDGTSCRRSARSSSTPGSSVRSTSPTRSSSGTTDASWTACIGSPEPSGRSGGDRRGPVCVSRRTRLSELLAPRAAVLITTTGPQRPCSGRIRYGTPTALAVGTSRAARRRLVSPARDEEER